MAKERWFSVNATGYFDKQWRARKRSKRFVLLATEVWLAYLREGRSAFANGYDTRVTRFLERFVDETRDRVSAAEWQRVKFGLAAKLGEELSRVRTRKSAH